MRRPHFCCDKQHEDGQCCPTENTGTLSRLCRFLAISLGRRPPVVPCQAPPCLKARGGSGSGQSSSTSATFAHLLSEIRREAENVLGRPLEEVMLQSGRRPLEGVTVDPSQSQGEQGHQFSTASHHGVPPFVHALCCYMLTHEVDYDTLVADDWCAEEIRSAIMDDMVPSGDEQLDLAEESNREATLCAGLLRLFLQELPHPLITKDVSSTLTGICKDAAERNVSDNDMLIIRRSTASRVRRILNNRLSPHNVRLLQYLTAFIHQLRTANHNTCPVSVSDLSRILGRIITRSDPEGLRRGAGFRIAEMLLVNYSAIFAGEASEDCEYNSDSLGSSCDGENTDTDLLLTSDDDDLQVGEGGTSSLSRDDAPPDDDDDSTTTTTTDTEELRSSPLRMPSTLGSSPGGRRRPSSPCRSRYPSNALWPSKKIGSAGANVGHNSQFPFESPSPVPPYDSSPTRAGPSSSKEWPSKSSPKLQRRKLSSDSLLSLPSTSMRHASSTEGGGGGPRDLEALPRKRKGTADGGTAEHDPKALRSASEIQDVETTSRHKIAPYGKSYLPSITDLLKSPDDSWRDEGIRSYTTDKEKWSQSAESSCLSDGGDESESEADRDADGSDTEGVPETVCPHEERRSSERSFPRSHKSSSSGGRRTRRRTRKKNLKDISQRVQSSEEEEKESGSFFASLISRDEEPATFDPTPPDVDSSQTFKHLLGDSEEPVTSDRGSWGSNISHSHNWRRIERQYSRYDDQKQGGTWFKENEMNSSSLIPQNTPNEESHPASQAAVKVLLRNMNSIKKKIKKFEEEFETAFGYRPSHSEKMKHKDIKKYMTELNKVRKELKQKKDDVAGMINVPNVFPVSFFRNNDTTQNYLPQRDNNQSSCGNNRAASTLREVEERLRERRRNAKRPTDLKSMTVDEIQDEKTALQKELLYYESVHGRPTSREDKDLARPLYDRYRQVKRSMIRSSSRTKENLIELAPILEHVVMDFTMASPQHRGSLQEEVDGETQKEIEEAAERNVEKGITLVGGQWPPQVVEKDTNGGSSRSDINLGDLHALPIHELKERKKEAKEEKKKLRKFLRDYEARFERDTGRKVQKEDRGSMDQHYTDYKHIKAKLRLLEALLSKHDSLKI